MRSLLALVVVLASACSDDNENSGPPPGVGPGPGGTTVGKPCTSDSQCASRCSSDMCTVSCGSDVQCPSWTACIGTSGGICALTCRTSADCAPDFECRSEERQGTSGSISVCKKR